MFRIFVDATPFEKLKIRLSIRRLNCDILTNLHKSSIKILMVSNKVMSYKIHLMCSIIRPYMCWEAIWNNMAGNCHAPSSCTIHLNCLFNNLIEVKKMFFFTVKFSKNNCHRFIVRRGKIITFIIKVYWRFISNLSIFTDLITITILCISWEYTGASEAIPNHTGKIDRHQNKRKQ